MKGRHRRGWFRRSKSEPEPEDDVDDEARKDAEWAFFLSLINRQTAIDKTRINPYLRSTR